MGEQKYQGVILAAGRGTRMGPFSENYPKPVLPVGNRPLIQRHIETMRDLGIRDIVVLVGHKGFEVSKVLGDGHALGVNIRYVEQTSMLGIAHAVGRLEPHVHDPFLLLLGDIFFVPGDMQRMFRLLEEQGGGAVLGTKDEDNPEAICRNFSVVLSPDGFVTRVVEKPRHTSNRLKGVGVYLFDVTVFDAIRRTPRSAMRDEYEITDSIQVMIDDGYPVRACDSVLDDVNLTTPGDLLSCNLMLARSAPGGVLVGANTRVPSLDQVRSSVIGSNVVVRHSIAISNSLIFDDTDVNSTAGFENLILTPHGTIDCNYELQSKPSSQWQRHFKAHA